MPAASPDKLVVSNGARLTQKYGAAGATAVNTAVKALIKADAARGIVTVFIARGSARLAIGRCGVQRSRGRPAR